MRMLVEVSSALVELDTITYYAAVSACKKCCQWDQALKPLWATAAAHVSAHNSQLVQDWKPVVEMASAQVLLSKMASAQVLLSTTPYKAAVSAREKVGRWISAAAHVNSDSITCNAAVSPLLVEMAAAHVKLDLIIFNAAVSAWQK